LPGLTAKLAKGQDYCLLWQGICTFKDWLFNLTWGFTQECYVFSEM